jgi:hybrid cluster-associated redox disulfide protein
MGNEFTKDMTFGELLTANPAAGRVLSDYGLHCVGCHIAVSESIEEGARVHGLNDDQIDAMMMEINTPASK